MPIKFRGAPEPEPERPRKPEDAKFDEFAEKYGEGSVEALKQAYRDINDLLEIYEEAAKNPSPEAVALYKAKMDEIMQSPDRAVNVLGIGVAAFKIIKSLGGM